MFTRSTAPARTALASAVLTMLLTAPAMAAPGAPKSAAKAKPGQHVTAKSAKGQRAKGAKGQKAAAKPVMVGPDAPGRPGDIQAPACGNNALLLTQYSYAYLQSHYCDLCGSVDELGCELDWPSSDVMLCSEVDMLRNTIFARYGYVFKTAKWAAVFKQKAWYKPDPSFTLKKLSPEAKQNATFLKKMSKAAQLCIPCRDDNCPG